MNPSCEACLNPLLCSPCNQWIDPTSGYVEIELGGNHDPGTYAHVALGHAACMREMDVEVDGDRMYHVHSAP